MARTGWLFTSCVLLDTQLDEVSQTACTYVDPYDWLCQWHVSRDLGLAPEWCKQSLYILSLSAGWLLRYKVSSGGLWVPEDAEISRIMETPNRGSLDPWVALGKATICPPPVHCDVNETCPVGLILCTVSDHWDLGLFVTAFSLTQLIQFPRDHPGQRWGTGGKHWRKATLLQATQLVCVPTLIPTIHHCFWQKPVLVFWVFSHIWC